MEQYWNVRERGFLPSSISKDFFDEVLRQHLSIIESIPVLLEEGKLKSRIAGLPRVNIIFEYESYYDSSCLLLENYPDCEHVFTIFGILTSSYVHCESEEFKKANDIEVKEHEKGRPVILPSCIAEPMKILAAHLGRKPILDYAGCVLTNWALLDEKGAIELENIRLLRTFTDLPAEHWFFKIHVMIEYHGAEAIKQIDIIQKWATNRRVNYEEESDLQNVEHVASCMEIMAESLNEMNAVLARMTENCKDYDFYNFIRPYLSGWSAPGVVYCIGDAIDFAPEIYSGGSGAQSSLMPCFDVFFGIFHDDKSDRVREPDSIGRKKFMEALKKYREYMPPPHRQYIEHLENSSNIRDFIAELDKTKASLNEKSLDKEMPIVTSELYRIKSINLGKLIDRLKSTYNHCVNQVLNFRRKHIGFAISYISSQAKRRARDFESQGDAATGEALLKKSAVGTGGSHFKNHLMQHINDTRKCLYEVGSDKPKDAPNPHKPKYVLPGLGPQLSKHSVFARRVNLPPSTLLNNVPNATSPKAAAATMQEASNSSRKNPENI